MTFSSGITSIITAGLLTGISLLPSKAHAQNIFVELHNIQRDNVAHTISFNVFVSGSTSYMAAATLNANNGLQNVDFAWDIDLGTDGTTTTVTPTSVVATKVGNIPNTVTGNVSLPNPPGGVPAGYDTKAKLSFDRIAASSSPITTMPTQVATVVVTLPSTAVIGTPANGAKIALRTITTLPGSKWSDFLGTTNQAVGSSAPQGTVTPLPIQLVSFDASATADRRAQLNWETATEQSSATFEVERSANGEQFTETVARVRAAGKSSTLLKYQSYDNEPLTGTNYYRLKMIDVDGKYTYSATRKVVFNGKAPEVVVYPTENYDGIVHVTLPQEWAEAQLHLVNAAGQTVNAPVDGLGLSRTVQLGALPAGIYTLQVNGGQGSQSFRISYQH